MILKNTIITLCLTSFTFLPAMNKKITPTTKQANNKKNLSLAEKRYKEIDDEFEKKWGYSIPSIVIEETIGNKVIYKAVSQEYVSLDPSAKIKILNDEDLANDLTTNVTSPRVETILTREGLLAAAKAKEVKQEITAPQADEIDVLNLEKEELNKRLIAATTLIEKKRSENAQLKKEIDHIQQKTHAAISLITKQQTKPATNNNNNTTKKKNRSKKKKQQAVNVEISNTTSPTTTETKQPLIQPTNTTQNLQEKRAILKTLFVLHNVKSENELKAKFAKECKQNGSDGQTGMLKGRIWNYSARSNQFIINPEHVAFECSDCNCPCSEDGKRIGSNW